jgi:hypothetical protein
LVSLLRFEVVAFFVCMMAGYMDLGLIIRDVAAEITTVAAMITSLIGLGVMAAHGLSKKVITARI